MSGLSDSASKRFPALKDRAGMMQDASPDSAGLRIIGSTINKATERADELEASQKRLASQQSEINRMQGQTASRSYSTLRARRGRAGSMSLMNNESTLG